MRVDFYEKLDGELRALKDRPSFYALDRGRTFPTNTRGVYGQILPRTGDTLLPVGVGHFPYRRRPRAMCGNMKDAATHPSCMESPMPQGESS